MEGKIDQLSSIELASGLSKKLERIDSEFRTHHFTLVDVIEDEETVLREQEILEDHDDEIVALTARIKQLMGCILLITIPMVEKSLPENVITLRKTQCLLVMESSP